MNIVIGSLFRQCAGLAITQYFRQVARLAAALPEDHIRLVLVEGDSTDATLAQLRREAKTTGLEHEIIQRIHGGPYWGSVVDPERFAKLAWVGNGVMEAVTQEDDVLVYVESDLLWDAQTMVALIRQVETRIVVCPLIIYPNGDFHDIWAYRKDGEAFAAKYPYHPALPSAEPVLMESAGSCLVMSAEVARAARFQPEDAIVGLCRNIRDLGWDIWLDPTLRMIHPFPKPPPQTIERKKRKGLRIIWQSNAPWAPTGYGRQAAHILPSLKRMPEVDDIIIFAFWGLQGGRIKHRIGGETFTIVPTTTDDWGNELINMYAAEFEADIVVTLLDIWPLNENYGQGIRWLPYMPIDIQPLPQAFLDRLRNAYLPITYSQHASRALDAAGIEYAYAPHGVDTQFYRPVPAWTERYRRSMGWPEAAVKGYVFGMVAANKGYPPRKAFPEVFEAFSRLLASGKDAWLYVHALHDGSHGGPDLQHMAKAFGIQERVLVPNKQLLLSGAYDDSDMLRLYNGFDCLLSPSYSEGFGIPIVEAQACGVPVIVTDAFAMSELVGAGWKVPWDHKLYVPIGASYVMPSVDALTEAMLEARETPKAKMAEQAREFALQYDWRRIVEVYWKPIIRRLHEEITPNVPVENGHRLEPSRIAALPELVRA